MIIHEYIFSQKNWLYSKYESKKILSTLSYCTRFWQFLMIFLNKNFHDFLFKQIICEIIFFSSKYFLQNNKNMPLKKYIYHRFNKSINLFNKVSLLLLLTSLTCGKAVINNLTHLWVFGNYFIYLFLKILFCFEKKFFSLLKEI
jgi:hypothetical protein